MDHAAALAAFDAQLRRVAGADHERVGPVIRRVSPEAGGWSGVEWADLDGHDADAVIAEQIAYFRALDRPFEWKYYAYDRPADLPARLAAAGLVRGADEALMVADVADIPLDVPVPDGVRIVTVTDPDALAAVETVHEAAFGEEMHGLFVELAERMRATPELIAPVLAMAGERPVSAARLSFHPGTEFAGLWGGGTVPEWRGRGIYRAVVAHRARLAAERGVRYLRTDALPTSRPVLEKLGFVALTTTVPFTDS